jgi:hypothetical protein
MPHDPRFLDMEPGSPGQDEQFHIECEALDRQPRKQGFSGRRAEQLESTLGIRNPRQHEQSHPRIEDAADDVPHRVFSDAL